VVDAAHVMVGGVGVIGLIFPQSRMTQKR
jgi:hypothetical protein